MEPGKSSKDGKKKKKKKKGLLGSKAAGGTAQLGVVWSTPTPALRPPMLVRLLLPLVTHAGNSPKQGSKGKKRKCHSLLFKAFFLILYIVIVFSFEI